MKKMITSLLIVGMLASAGVTFHSAYAKTKNERRGSSDAHLVSFIHRTQAMAPVNLNNADVKSLMKLKGIGKKRAEAIVAYRKKHGPFRSVSDLAKVHGVSGKFVQRLMEKNPNRIMIAQKS